MLSVQPHPVPARTHIPLHVEEHKPPKDVELNEVSDTAYSPGPAAHSPFQLGSLQEALEPFAK